jgi:hypothetical protein
MFIKKIHDKRISLSSANDTKRELMLANYLKTPKNKLITNSQDKTEGKIYSVKITPFVEKKEDNENAITTVKIQLKSKAIYYSNNIENQQIEINNIRCYSEVSSITPFSISSFLSESATLSNLDSTINATNGDVYEAMQYNNPLLPIGKENNENFKINLISQLKNDKCSKFNSAGKKRKYSCISQTQDISEKFRKISSDRRLYESNIKFNAEKGNTFFKIYREADIFINCERYEDLLIDSQQDDDVETDEEQLIMAIQCVNKMLGKAIKEKLINDYI